MNTNNTINRYFRGVEAQKITLMDNFLAYTPQSKSEEKLKNDIMEAIRNGVKDFWVPSLNPGMDYQTKQIIFLEGEEACTMSRKMWELQAEVYCPERGSKIGDKYERAIFLAHLIKQLICGGLSRERAWQAITGLQRELDPLAKAIISRWEDTSTLKITITEGNADLWGGETLCNCFDVGYNFSYCDNAVGWVILTKPEIG